MMLAPTDVGGYWVDLACLGRSRERQFALTFSASRRFRRLSQRQGNRPKEFAPTDVGGYWA